jgi:predicted adenine nucleotide alpha hydrolase (AANH) superfamily ATPase
VERRRMAEQKRNYQRELEKIIEENQAAGKIPKLLLHACCAPCSSYCLEYLNRYFDITVFYYNPNIDDAAEYHKRAAEEERLIASMPFVRPVAFLEGDYTPALYHARVKGHEEDPEGGERCGICFALRLQKTAETAREKGFDFFTTTLSISPLKNAERLNTIGEKTAAKTGAVWLPSDFKKKNGYRRSTELSAEYGLYRQNYCGCSFSKRDTQL